MKYFWSGSLVVRLCLVTLWLGVSCLTVIAQQPNLTATGALNQGRFSHTATLLANGKVLLAGGFSRCGDFFPPCPLIDSAELYDPATGQWSLTGKMSIARAGHNALRLNNGKVLVAGGVGNTPSGSEASAELYDPATGQWTATGNLNAARRDARAVLLANGKVLVSGGIITVNGLLRLLDTAEVYDPATGTWSLTGGMTIARQSHSLTLLPNGQVLAAGGWSNASNPGGLILVGSAELYNPASNTWSATSNLNQARRSHAAILLANGRVLVATGFLGFDAGATLTAELYDPASGVWSVTGNANRYRDRGLLLPNGKVLALGQDGQTFSTEIYDPASGTWGLNTVANTFRDEYTATLLSNGKVLIAGGARLEQTQGGRNAFGITSAELYDPGTPLGPLGNVSAASFHAEVASEAIVAAFGVNLTNNTGAATTLPLPTTLAGVTVKVRDNSGIERNAPLFFVSPGQINYQIPIGTSSGAANVTVLGNGEARAVGLVQVTTVAPGLFSANADGQGVAAAVVVRLRAGGAQSFEPVATFDAAQNRFVAAPIDLGPETEQVFLLLFGTGLRQLSAPSGVTALLGGTSAAVEYAGSQGQLAGLDQVNLRLPRALAGRGEVNVALMAEGKAANVVTVSLR